MKKYRTYLKIEVEAENEEEAIRKMYELVSSGEVSINDLEEI